MAKAKKRENVWLQCKDCGALNYRTEINVAQGIPEGLKEGLSKFCSTDRKHTTHKVKRK